MLMSLNTHAAHKHKSHENKTYKYMCYETTEKDFLLAKHARHKYRVFECAPMKEYKV